MTSEYALCVTVLTPQSLSDEANELAKVYNTVPGGGETFNDFSWEDADGNKYGAACFAAKQSFLSTVASPLTQPEWEEVDLSLAQTAQAVLVTHSVAAGGTAPTANPSKITVYFPDLYQNPI